MNEGEAVGYRRIADVAREEVRIAAEREQHLLEDAPGIFAARGQRDLRAFGAEATRDCLTDARATTRDESALSSESPRAGD